jgi:hypothetical protein
MALIYMVRQLSSGPNAGKWHYTAGSDEGGGTFAVGACAENCAGHATAQEAELHHAEGICGGEIRERESIESKKKCVSCGEWTQHRAMLWRDAFPNELAICETHDVRSVLRAKYFEERGLPITSGDHPDARAP